jgi:hypothetical protein
MTTPENPFDKTVWDPVDPEQAIEDSLHGPEAIASLLAVPPYRNEDGTYYVFGASYVCGTSTFDAEGKPFIKFKMGMDSGFMRELDEHGKWIEAYKKGELEPIEEMDLPAFAFEETPYLVLDSPFRVDPELNILIMDTLENENLAVSFPSESNLADNRDDLEDKIQASKAFYKGHIAEQQETEQTTSTLSPQLGSLLPEIKRLVDESNRRIAANACTGFNPGQRGEFRRLIEECRNAWQDHVGANVDEAQFNSDLQLIFDALNDPGS